MARTTKHVVQTYLDDPERGPVLSFAVAIDSEAAALERARALAQTGRYIGVEAVTVSGDRERGEYDEPVRLIRYGTVPEEEVELPANHR